VEKIADEEHVISFVGSPRIEKIADRSLYRYELSFQKEAFRKFYKRLLTEAPQKTRASFKEVFDDQGFMNYLESAEFDQVFDYFTQNTSFVLWVDGAGFPAMSSYTIRVVPPDTAVALKDKQANVVFKTEISDINSLAKIKAPTDAKLLEDVIKEQKVNQYGSGGTAVTAGVRASLSEVRVAAEVFYDKNNDYGKKAFAVGSCKKTAGTLFADKDVFSAIEEATGGDASKATCISQRKTSGVPEGYAISVPLPGLTGYSWCVDSNGVSKQISGSVKSIDCK
jgi:hypothetical protein